MLYCKLDTSVRRLLTVRQGLGVSFHSIVSDDNDKVGVGGKKPSGYGCLTSIMLVLCMVFCIIVIAAVLFAWRVALGRKLKGSVKC